MPDVTKVVAFLVLILPFANSGMVQAGNDDRVVNAEVLTLDTIQDQNREELARLKDIVSRLTGKDAMDLQARLDQIQEKLNSSQTSLSDEQTSLSDEVVEQAETAVAAGKLPLEMTNDAGTAESVMSGVSSIEGDWESNSHAPVVSEESHEFPQTSGSMLLGNESYFPSEIGMPVDSTMLENALSQPMIGPAVCDGPVYSVQIQPVVQPVFMLVVPVNNQRHRCRLFRR